MFKALKEAVGNIAKSIEENQRLRREAEEKRQAQEREYVARLKRGQLPTVTSRLLLEVSEYAFLEVPAQHVRTLKSSTQHKSGTLTVTNTRVIFTSADQSGGWEVSHGKILAVNGQGPAFNLEATSAKCSGQIQTSTPYAGLITESAVKLNKRLLDMRVDGEQRSRSISQPVKAAVWQRDKGQCVQCSATDYLEFDHIIPFSKGGSNSETNIQLLCRRCNLAKSNHI